MSPALLYVDTSALAKLLVVEAESAALVAWWGGQTADGLVLVSSSLAETELRRMAVRLGLPQTAASEVLSRIALAEPDRALFTAAGLLPGVSLRSLDALHLATALRVGAAVLVTYDERLADAATSAGLQVAAPA